MGALTHNGEVLQSLPANASQINFDKTGTDLNSTQTEDAIKEVNTKANTLQSGKANTDMVASDFDATASYTAGNYCIYEGKFYKFKNNHSGAWSAADVDEIKIAGELSSLKSGLTNLNNLNNLYLSFSATDMQDYLSQAIENFETNFQVGITVNAIGVWQGTCTFMLQVCRPTSTQTIISAIPQPNNYVSKMWVGMKENNTFTYSTIDMAVVS